MSDRTPKATRKAADVGLSRHIYSDVTWVDLELTFYYNNFGNLERIESWNAPYFNIDTIKTWIQHCKHEHGKLCENEPEHLPEGFRLLDMEEMRVFKPKYFFPFIALSYVWSSPIDTKNVQLDLANLEQFGRVGGIDLEELPDTISDCIQVCKLLGERYLWVDRLCIIQDEATSKHNQICGMDRIYSAAKLTIICATNTRRVTGLPGIPNRPRQSFKYNQTRLPYIDKLKSKLGCRMEYVLTKSTWNSRCWTMQEMLFSHKCLYFTDFQVFFTCPQMIWKEETGIIKDPSDRWGNSLLGIKSLTKFEDYWNLVNAYTQKHLTYETDVLNAFAGIANTLSDTFKTRFWFGVPEIYLPQSILWNADYILGNKKILRRRKDVPQIPSWSWAAWVGNIQHVSMYDQVGLFAKLIDLYAAMQEQSELLLLSVDDYIYSNFPLNSHDHIDFPTATGTDFVSSLWRSCPHNPWSPEIHTPIDEEYRVLGQNHPGAMVFYSTVAQVIVKSSFDPMTREMHKQVRLYDPSGDPIGLAGLAERRRAPIAPSLPSTHTFVALCAGFLDNRLEPEMPNWTRWILAGLLVEKQDGIYRRLVPGVAYVQVSLWHRANPKWETVVLA